MHKHLLPLLIATRVKLSAHTFVEHAADRNSSLTSWCRLNSSLVNQRPSSEASDPHYPAPDPAYQLLPCYFPWTQEKVSELCARCGRWQTTRVSRPRRGSTCQRQTPCLHLRRLDRCCCSHRRSTCFGWGLPQVGSRPRARSSPSSRLS